MKIPESIKSIPPLEIALIILFILYIVFPFNTPKMLASSIDSPLGMIAIFCVTVYLFMYTHPILAILYIFVAYELIRRSSQVTGKVAMVKYTPSQINKDIELRAMNPPQEKTLEEDIIDIRAPIGKNPPLQFVDSGFKPVSDKMIAGASMV